MKPAAFRSNRPAKPPSSALHPGERKPRYRFIHSFHPLCPSFIMRMGLPAREVALARGLIMSTSLLPAAMSTPLSL